MSDCLIGCWVRLTKKILKTLWRIGEELSYPLEEGKHFDTIDASTEFGGIKFNHRLAFAPKKPCATK